MGKGEELISAAQTGNLVQIDKILGQKSKKPGPLLSIRKSVGPNYQDQNGYTPIHHAALNGRRDAVEALLKYGASTNIPDFAGSYPLHLAAWNGHADVVELLLNRGPSRANVNEQNNNNETALHLACQYGHNTVVVVLLECHAEPSFRNVKHESAIDLAAQYGRLESVNCLLMYYPALVKKTIGQHTPIHLASRNGHYAVVKSLIDKGMSPNILDEDGTPLHVAALYGKSDIVKLLLQSGVDINKKNKANKTVMDLLSANPTQRSREITAWIYTYLHNAKHSSLKRGQNRALSEADAPIQLTYDAIPPPRPLSEFGNSSDKNQSTYDKVPIPVSSRAGKSQGSSSEIANENYDFVPSRPVRDDTGRLSVSQINRQTSYDEVPVPRPMIEIKHANSTPNSIGMSSSPPCYDYVPPPRQASDPFLDDESAYGAVGRPKSLDVNAAQYKVPVTNLGVPRQSPIQSSYGVVTSNRPLEHRSTIAAVPSRYAMLNYPREANVPLVTSVYGVVQIPDSRTKSPAQAEGPDCRISTTSEKSNRSLQLVDTYNNIPQRHPSLSKTSDATPQSSYELVELPAGKTASLGRNDRSAPISIPSQDRVLSHAESTYHTVTSPPMRRIDPIGAPESPYGNLDPIVAFQEVRAAEAARTTREEREGDGSRHSDTRREPEGAKEHEQRGVTSSRSGGSEYENVVLPKRTTSLHYQKDPSIYQNTPVSPPLYEYNVPNPNPKARTLPRSPSRGQGNVNDPRFYSSPEIGSGDYKTSGSPRGSPSSERSRTDYENVELPYRSPSGGSPSSLKSRNPYEILPPHVLHAPVEPGSAKPDAQGKVKPPLPKPYHESRKSTFDISNDRGGDYCTLKEALAGVVSPENTRPEENSNIPPFSPPSPSTAGQYLFSALKSNGQQRDSGGSDESGGRMDSDCTDGNPRNRSRTLKYENVMFDKPSPSEERPGNESQEGMFNDSYRLSSVNDGPLNEYEEWKKIELFMNILGEDIGEERKEAEDHMTSGVGKWLKGFGLGLYESYLLANGFDDIEFMADGVLQEQDLLQMGVLDPVYRKTILDHVTELAPPLRVGVHGFEPKTVEEWLNALHLDVYIDLFHRKGYNTMDRIKQMWELELESVLAIHTLGHRKRILASLPEVKRRDSEAVTPNDIRERLAAIDVFGGERRESLDVVNPGIYKWQTVEQMSTKAMVEKQEQQRQKQLEAQQLELQQQETEQQRQLQQPQLQQQQLQQQQLHQQQLQPQQLHQQQLSQKEDRPQQSIAPKAPPRHNRPQDEKVGNTENKFQKPNWCHPPEALLKGNVNYTTKYLGSHFIKDVIGESSTVEACRKMRMSTQKLQKIPAVILSVSVTGVRFIDARSRIVISSHYIHNISYCTQDLEDRSVLAYIAKDQKANAHYCHVFKANSSAISDEIVMTVGQAFELAFQQYTRAQYTAGNH